MREMKSAIDERREALANIKPGLRSMPMWMLHWMPFPSNCRLMRTPTRRC